jgi:hypothetical protein
MDLTRRAAVISTLILEGLLPTDWYRLVCAVVRLRMDLLRPTQIMADIDRMQREGFRIINECNRLSIHLKAPNTVALMELLIYDLPCYGCLHFADSRPFEAFHQPHKRSRALRNPELNAGDCTMVRDSWRYMLHGGDWGENGRYRAASRVIGLRDPREGLRHLPHPLLRSITAYLPQIHPTDGETVKWYGADSWRPSHYQWKAGKRVVAELKTDELSALQLACTTYFSDILTLPLREYAEIKYYAPMSVSIHEKALHVGDDVLTKRRRSPSMPESVASSKSVFRSLAYFCFGSRDGTSE